MYVGMNMRTTSRAYRALPLVGGACSALVHLLWRLGASCPDFSAPLPTCSACWVLTLFAHCVAIPACTVIESRRWQTFQAYCALPLVFGAFRALVHLVWHLRWLMEPESVFDHCDYSLVYVAHGERKLTCEAVHRRATAF